MKPIYLVFPLTIVLGACVDSSDGDPSLTDEIPASESNVSPSEVPSNPTSDEGTTQVTSETTNDGAVVGEVISTDNGVMPVNDEATSPAENVSTIDDTTDSEPPMTLDDEMDPVTDPVVSSVPVDSSEIEATQLEGLTILPDMAEDLLASVIESVNGIPFSPELDVAKAVHPDGTFGADSVNTEAGLIASGAIDGAATFNCENGGFYTYRASSDEFGGGEGEFFSCSSDSLIGGALLDGGFSRTQTVLNGPIESSARSSTMFTNLRSVDLDGNQRYFSGQVSLSKGTINDATPAVFSHSEALTGLELTTFSGSDGSVTRIKGTYILLDAVSSADPNATLKEPMTYEAFFKLTSPQTGGTELSVRTNAPFSTIEPKSAGENGCYESGTLEVIAEDGSAMIMQLDNGDPNTFQLDVNALNGSTSLTVSWEDRFELSRFPVSSTEEPDNIKCTR